jgi:uncharacterized protein YjbI with pentapeptide repeats
MTNGGVCLLTALEKQTRMVGSWLRAEQFAGVDFAETVFEKARCEGAVFVEVNFRRADFRGAFLREARFVRCDLAGAGFPEADVAFARFIDCRGLTLPMVTLLRQRGAHVSDDPTRAVGAA